MLYFVVCHTQAAVVYPGTDHLPGRGEDICYTIDGFSRANKFKLMVIKYALLQRK